MNVFLNLVAELPANTIALLDDLQLRLFRLCQDVDPRYCSGPAAEFFNISEVAYQEYLERFSIRDALRDFWIAKVLGEQYWDSVTVNLDVEPYDETETDSDEPLSIAALAELGETTDLLEELAEDAGFSTGIPVSDLLNTVFRFEDYYGYGTLSLARIYHPLIKGREISDIVYERGGACLSFMKEETVWILCGFPIAADPEYSGDQVCDLGYVESMYCVRPAFLQEIAKFELAKQNNNEERRAS